MNRLSKNDTRYSFELDSVTLDKARKDALRRGMSTSEHMRDLMRSYCASDRSGNPPERSEGDCNEERGPVSGGALTIEEKRA